MIINCIGNVDVGKSSLISRILLNTGAIKSNELNKSIQHSKQWLANLIDTDKNKQERGMTLYSSVEKFIIDGKSFKIINNPGHIILSNQIIKNSCIADIALLVLSAKKNETENSIKQGYEYCLISRVNGINHLIVALNKSEYLNSSDNKYETIVNKVKKAFKNIKFNTIHILPISAKLNFNIHKNDSVNSNHSLFDILKSIKVHRRESRTIKPLDNKINCKLFFHKISQLISIGFNCILHSQDKIFNAEFIEINNKSHFITEKNKTNDFIDCKLKVETNTHLDYSIILKNRDDILAYGIIY